jgi:hypothetical protein
MIDDVVAGRFREAIVLPPTGDAWMEWERWLSPCRFSGRLQVDREAARAMLAEIEGRSIAWSPGHNVRIRDRRGGWCREAAHSRHLTWR